MPDPRGAPPALGAFRDPVPTAGGWPGLRDALATVAQGATGGIVFLTPTEAAVILDVVRDFGRPARSVASS